MGLVTKKTSVLERMVSGLMCSDSINSLPLKSQVRRSLGKAPTQERLRGTNAGTFRVSLYGTEWE